jgi:hypothetical protein
MKNFTLIKSLSFFIALFCGINFGFGQILTFEFAGNNGDELSVVSNSNDPNLAVSTITRGSGLNATANLERFNATGWAATSIANAISGNDYMEFTIAPNSGYQFDITTISINFQRSGTGPRGIVLRSSIDGYTTNIDTEKALADITNTTEIFSFTVNHTNNATAVTYRFYCWAEAGTGTGGFEGAGDDIIVAGNVSALPACGGVTTTWNAGSWDNGTPDLSTPAVISSSYNTGVNGSFSACSLTINAGATLNINDEDNGSLTNTYVVVQNDVTVDGSILMNPKATFVQLSDGGLVNGAGTVQVEKLTAPMNAWYEYTYWSSPVSGVQISTALTDSDASRRYTFNGQNFLDATAETGNNNATVDGQDDIDDNNNDWNG